MASFGYRLFTFRIAAGATGRKEINFKECSGEHYLDVVIRAMKALTQDTMISEPPTKPGEQAITAGAAALAAGVNYADEPAFRVEDFQVVENTIRATIMSGKFGSHGKALSAGGPSADADISDKAPARHFRVVLTLPTSGTVGILGVESIVRTVPVTPLVKWLHWRSQQDVEEQLVQGGSRTTSWRPMVKPLADYDRLLQMIRAGRVEGLELYKHYTDAARNKQVRKFKVTAPVLDEGMANRVAGVVRGWIDGSATEDELTGQTPAPLTTARDAAKQLAAIIGPEIVQLEADEGFVVLQEDDDSDKTRKISPTQMSEIFTYAQPSGLKTDTPSFYALVRMTAMRLQKAADIAVSWPAQ